MSKKIKLRESPLRSSFKRCLEEFTWWRKCLSEVEALGRDLNHVLVGLGWG